MVIDYYDRYITTRDLKPQAREGNVIENGEKRTALVIE